MKKNVEFFRFALLLYEIFDKKTEYVHVTMFVGNTLAKDDKENVMLYEDENPSESPFLRLFVTNQKSIYAFILALVHNYIDADDILQETSVVMWQKFGEYQPGTDFIAWGITIARYQVLKFFRLRSRSKVQFNDDLLHAISDSTEAQLADLDGRLRALRSCRKKLSEQDRSLVEMKYDQGIPFKKIAERTGRSVHVIYKNMSRIQNALLRCIDQILSRGLLPK